MCGDSHAHPNLLMLIASGLFAPFVAVFRVYTLNKLKSIYSIIKMMMNQLKM